MSPGGPPARLCLWCGATGMSTRRLKLSTTGMTFMGLDWANRDAVCLICDSCGYIHWFQPRS